MIALENAPTSYAYQTDRLDKKKVFEEALPPQITTNSKGCISRKKLFITDALAIGIQS